MVGAASKFTISTGVFTNMTLTHQIPIVSPMTKIVAYVVMDYDGSIYYAWYDTSGGKYITKLNSSLSPVWTTGDVSAHFISGAETDPGLMLSDQYVYWTMLGGGDNYTYAFSKASGAYSNSPSTSTHYGGYVMNDDEKFYGAHGWQSTFKRTDKENGTNQLIWDSANSYNWSSGGMSRYEDYFYGQRYNSASLAGVYRADAHGSGFSGPPTLITSQTFRMCNQDSDGNLYGYDGSNVASYGPGGGSRWSTAYGNTFVYASWGSLSAVNTKEGVFCHMTKNSTELFLNFRNSSTGALIRQKKVIPDSDLGYSSMSVYSQEGFVLANNLDVFFVNAGQDFGYGSERRAYFYDYSSDALTWGIKETGYHYNQKTYGIGNRYGICSGYGRVVWGHPGPAGANNYDGLWVLE